MSGRMGIGRARMRSPRFRAGCNLRLLYARGGVSITGWRGCDGTGTAFAWLCFACVCIYICIYVLGPVVLQQAQGRISVFILFYFCFLIIPHFVEYMIA